MLNRSLQRTPVTSATSDLASAAGSKVYLHYIVTQIIAEFIENCADHDAPRHACTTDFFGPAARRSRRPKLTGAPPHNTRKSAPSSTYVQSRLHYDYTLLCNKLDNSFLAFAPN